MNPYWWICNVCNFGNPPELTSCSNCGPPAKAINSVVDNKCSKQNNSANQYFSKLSVTQKIVIVLTSVSSCIGVLLSRVDTPKLSLIGLVLVVFGVVVFIAIRNNVSSKEAKIPPK